MHVYQLIEQCIQPAPQMSMVRHVHHLLVSYVICKNHLQERIKE